MQNLDLIFNDRMFEDGWAEPYMVNLQFEANETYNANDLTIALQECANNLSEDMNCSEDGIEMILRDFMKSHPELKNFSYKISFISGICFGHEKYVIN